MPMSQDQIRLFKLKARAGGFSEQQINQEVARKQQEETRLSLKRSQAQDQGYTQPEVLPAATSVKPTPQPRTLGGLAKNAVQDVVDFGINTPIDTAKKILGAGFEGTRAIVSSADRKRSEQKQNELMELTRQMKAEKDPVKRKTIMDKAKLVNKELDAIGKNLQGDTAKNPFVDVNELPENVGDIAKGILKNVGRSIGLTQDESGRIVFNLDTAIQSAYEKPVTTILMGKDVLAGVKKATGRGAADAALKDTGEAVVKKPGIVEKAGSDLRKGVLNPKVDATPFYAEDVAVMQKVQSKLGLKGSAEAQLEQLPNLFKKTTTEIKSQLKNAPKVKEGTLSNEFLSEVDNANYGLDDIQFSKAVESEMNVLKNLEGKSPSAYYDQLEKYRDLLKSTRKKIDSGTTLLPKEEARLAAFNALKSSIDTVSPEVRALNTIQNHMYNISEGLVKSRGKKGIGVGPVRLPNQVGQGAQDLAGQALEGASGIPGKIGSKIPKINTPLGTGAAMELSSSLTSSTQPVGDETQYPEGDIQDNTETDYGQNDLQTEDSIPTHPIFGQQSKQEVLLDAFKHGLNEKQLKEIETIYDRFAPAGAAVDKETQGVANDLRKEYISETKNNGFREVTNAYKKVLSAPDTPAGDVSLVFAYMKMLDPGSVVREGEFATAENTAGIPEKIVNAYNKAVSGKRLGKEQRAGFIDAAGASYRDYKSSQDAIDQQYNDLAKRYGVDPALLGIGTINIKEPKKKILTPEAPKQTSKAKTPEQPAVDIGKAVKDVVGKVGEALIPEAKASEGPEKKQVGWKDAPGGGYEPVFNTDKNPTPQYKYLPDKAKTTVKEVSVSTNSKEATKTPYNKDIKKVFGDEWVNATRVLKHKKSDGSTGGENGAFNPKVDNRNTDGTTDRGLFQINSATFADFKRRKPDEVKKTGASSYKDLYNPTINIKMAKLIYDEQGWKAWYGAPNDLRNSR